MAGKRAYEKQYNIANYKGFTGMFLLIRWELLIG
jgi:hypothetical protein